MKDNGLPFRFLETRVLEVDSKSLKKLMHFVRRGFILKKCFDITYLFSY